MDKHEFEKIINFDNEISGINGIGDKFWEIAEIYRSYGYLDVCNVYRIIADVYTDEEDDEETPHSWIDIYELNSDIIIKILEYSLYISEERKDWIKEGMDSSYYRKMYYILHYEEKTADYEESNYSFFLGEVFTELKEAIDHASLKIEDYCGYNVEVAFDTNDKAFEYLEIFSEDNLLDDNDILVMEEIFSLYKGKNGSEIFKILQEKQQMKEMTSDLEDEEIKIQFKINKSNEKINNLNSTISGMDEKIKVLKDLIKGLNNSKKKVLEEKIILEQDTIGFIKDITNIKNQKMEITYKMEDILMKKKILEDDNDLK